MSIVSTSRIVVLVSALASLPGSAIDAMARGPDQIRGKSVVVAWTEFRRERDWGGGPERNVRAPFKFVVYVGKDGQVFNRLQVGNGGKSDQVGDSRDPTGFAPRKIGFGGQTLSATNSFGGGAGARRIAITFGDGFASCSANVVVGLSGRGSAKQVTIRGTYVELFEAHSGPATCAVSNANALAD